MAISTCVVSGTIKDLENNAVSGATVKAKITSPFFHSDGTYIADYQVSTTVDGTGAWSLTLIETASISRTILVEIAYQIGSESMQKKVYAITVPNTSTANLSDLVTTE